MRNHQIFLILTGLTLLCLAILSCSSSDSNSTGPVDEETLLYMRETAVSDVEEIVGITLLGFENIDGFDTLFYDSINGGFYAKLAQPADEYFNYSYTNGWHILNAGADTASYEDSGYYLMDIDMSDSVQFKNGSQIVSEPDESTDFLDFRYHMQAMMEASSSGFALGFDIDQFNISNQYTLLPNDYVNVDGVVEYDYEMSMSFDGSTATVSMDYYMTIEDLVLDQQYGCPQSGTITATASMSASGEGQYESGNFYLTIEFVNSYTMDIHFEMDGSVWDGTETFDCSDFATASPLDLSNRMPQ